MTIRRKYNTATTGGTHVGIKLLNAAGTGYATSADWTPAAGDVKVSKDGGAEANIATLPSYANGWWIFEFSASELSCKSLRVSIAEAGGIFDAFVIETFGHSNAMWAADPTDLSVQAAAVANYSGGAVGGTLYGTISSASTNSAVVASRLTATRAGYLDNLSGGAVALASSQSTIIGHLTDIKGATFDTSTDSLEAIRDRGDAAWITATGFAVAGDIPSAAAIAGQVRTELATELGRIDVATSTRSSHGAADVWSVESRTITGGTVGAITGLTISTLETMATRWAGMVESDGAGGYRYTAGALSQAPSGGGGGGYTADDRTRDDATAARVQTLTTAAEITHLGPVLSSGDVEIVAGDDYANIDGRALEWSSEAWPDLTDASVEWVLYDRHGTELLRVDATVVTPTGTALVRVELTAEQTTLPTGRLYKHDLIATIDDRTITLFEDAALTVR